MKKAAKVFLIYKIIASILYIGVLIFVMIFSIKSLLEGVEAELWFGPVSWWFLIASQIAGIILGIITLSVCSNAIRKLKTAKVKEDIRSTAIWTLFFGQFIAGIIMLCMKDENLVIPIFK